MIPVRLRAVPVLFDERNFPQHAALHHFARTDHAGIAAELGADLDDAAAGLRRLGGVVGAEEFVELGRQRLLDVDVLAGLGRGFKMRGVLVIGRRDHHGVDPVQREQIAIRDKRLRLAAERLLDDSIRALAGRLPGISDRNDFEVRFLDVRENALFEMRAASATAAADLGDANPIVGSNRSFALGGGEESRRRRCDGRACGKRRGGFQKSAAGEGGFRSDGGVHDVCWEVIGIGVGERISSTRSRS